MPHATTASIPVLLCRSRGRLCALPLQHVAETMRALPIDVLPGMPAGVLGMATVRGVPVPVLDLGELTGAGRSSGRRFVTLRVGERSAALALDEVQGVATLGAEHWRGTPPLLAEAGGGVVEGIARHDAELALVLRAGRLLPEPDALMREVLPQ